MSRKNKKVIGIGDVVELLNSYPCLDPEHKRGIISEKRGIDSKTGLQMWGIMIPEKFLLHHCRSNVLTCKESEFKKVF